MAIHASPIDAIEHDFHVLNGARLHVATVGNGPPLLLLHGWPEFWLTWEPVMARLSNRFRLIAPDLRGFGDSNRPDGAFGADDHASDMLAILDDLGCRRVGLIGHDIGGAVVQSLARRAPDRFAGLFFFDFVHPGIGPRFGTPDRLREIWYMAFHETDLAPALIGATPETVRLYITHFLKHWSHRKDAFDDVLDRFVEAYQNPGSVEGSLAHYRASAAARLAMLRGEAEAPPPITLPTCVRWAEHDPMFDYAWTDRLHESFPNLDLAPFPGVGHFPHREDPDRAAAEIARFFSGLR